MTQNYTYILKNGILEFYNGVDVITASMVVDILRENNVTRNKLKKVIIPESVFLIDEDAFKNCVSLKDVVLNEGLKRIGYGAFAGCEGLTTIKFPNSLECIEEYVFQYCRDLQNIYFGNGLKTVKESAFNACTNILNVYPASVESWCKINFENSFANPLRYAKNFNMEEYCNGHLNLSDSIKSIGSFAFSCLKTMKSVYIPPSIITINKSAFYLCNSIEEIHISDVKKWCEIDFETADSNPLFYGEKMYLNGSRLNNLVIPNDINVVKRFTFAYMSELYNLQIPGNIKEIQEGAFDTCYNLQNIKISNGVERICEEAFGDCSKLRTVIFPDSILYIHENAFGTSFNKDMIFKGSDNRVIKLWAENNNITIKCSKINNFLKEITNNTIHLNSEEGL